MSRDAPPQNPLPPDALEKWNACPACQIGLPCEKALKCILSGTYEFRKQDHWMHAWPWVDRVTRMMCYAHRDTCTLRDCEYLHEYHGHLCTGSHLHLQFIRTRRAMQRRIAGCWRSQVRAYEPEPPDTLSMFPDQSVLLDRCDMWRAILEDCQYLGMTERLMYLDDWTHTLTMMGEDRWKPLEHLPMTHVLECVRAWETNVAQYRSDILDMHGLFLQFRNGLSLQRSTGHAGMFRTNLPPVMASMPVSYWLARHHHSQLRESRLFPNLQYTVTNGQHFHYSLWLKARATMLIWPPFHFILLDRMWPHVRRVEYLNEECIGTEILERLEDYESDEVVV